MLRGTVGFVVPSLAELKKRLEFAGAEMKRVVPEAKTKFSWQEKDGVIEATCPWGNRVRCHAPRRNSATPSSAWSTWTSTCHRGPPTASRALQGSHERTGEGWKGGRATVGIGRNQYLYFTETTKPLPEYDNHHIQIYIADFGSPYHWLKERDLITMETDADEWRFQWIVDPRDARKLFQIEHEMRSMKHRLFNRPLVNRNHGITNMTYVPGTTPSAAHIEHAQPALTREHHVNDQKQPQRRDREAGEDGQVRPVSRRDLRRAERCTPRRYCTTDTMFRSTPSSRKATPMAAARPRPLFAASVMSAARSMKKPSAMRPDAVRVQASNVRSAANSTRGSLSALTRRA